MITWILASSSVAQPHFAEPDRQWLGATVTPPNGPSFQTHRIVVLGVHPTRPWVAFRRLVSTMEGGAREPVDCDYAGIGDGVSGVQLGVFDLDQGKNLHGWWIYAPSSEVDACLSHEVSKQRLEQAKATFAEIGIDISTPPAPRPLQSVGLSVDDRVASQLKQKGSDFELHGQSLWRSSEELYVREYADFHPDYHRVSFGDAYSFRSRTFVVECVYAGVKFRGGVNRCTFTPPLP